MWAEAASSGSELDYMRAPPIQQPERREMPYWAFGEGRVGCTVHTSLARVMTALVVMVRDSELFFFVKDFQPSTWCRCSATREELNDKPHSDYKHAAFLMELHK